MPGSGVLGNRLVSIAPALLAVGAAVVVFWGTLRGGWVYDDQYQILRNRLIQREGHAQQVLLSDVWSFASATREPVSNYWRPTFMAWLMVNHRVFGLSDPTGWHAGNLLLHALATLLVFVLARRLGAGPSIAGAIALLFAVHPVHLESVAWVSASPDLLMSVGLLGAMVLLIEAMRGGRAAGWKLALAMGLYIFAQGAKEAAIAFPALVALLAWEIGPGGVPGNRRLVRALTWAGPFIAIAAAYLGARLAVLGSGVKTNGEISLAEAALSLPVVAVWYVRQCFWPLPLSPTYTVPVVSPATASVATLALPIAACIAAVLGAAWLCRRRPGRDEAGRDEHVNMARVGTAMFALLLLPAMNLMTFPVEQPVHDRYLYLPLCGALLTVVPAAAWLVGRVGESRQAAWAGRGGFGGWVVSSACAGAAAALGVASARAAPQWRTDLSLWSWSARAAPESSLSHRMLGVFLLDDGRAAEALAALDRSIAIRPDTTAYLARAEALVELHRYAEAERQLRWLLTAPEARGMVDIARASERLAVCCERQGRLSEAEQVLRSARLAAPFASPVLTEKIAVVLYQMGRKDEALSELEAVLPQVPGATIAGAQMVYYRLGLLYDERGRKDEAAAMFRAYLRESEGLTNKQTRAARPEAERRLGVP